MPENGDTSSEPEGSDVRAHEATPRSTKTDLEIQKLSLEINSLQRKLKLEIEKLGHENINLKRRNRFEPVLQLVPVVTSAIATIGLVIGLILSQQAQKREQQSKEAERREKLLSKISTDEEEILRFAQDKNQTLSRVAFLFRDINAAMQNGANGIQALKRPFTENLVSIIIKDLDFEKSPRDVGFAVRVLRDWEDYEYYLRDNPDKLKFILYRYVNALSYLNDMNPSYLQNIRVDRRTNEYEALTPEKQLGLLPNFLEVSDGFREHIKLAAGYPSSELRAIKENSIREFEVVLCNPELAKQILGGDYTGRDCYKPER